MDSSETKPIYKPTEVNSNQYVSADLGTSADSFAMCEAILRCLIECFGCICSSCESCEGCGGCGGCEGCSDG